MRSTLPIPDAQRLIATIAPELADSVALRIDDRLSCAAWANRSRGEITFRDAGFVTPGIVCHEVAHLLSGPALPQARGLLDIVRADPAPLAELGAALAATACDPPWAAHEDRWIRCVLHLLWRTVAAGGYEITPGGVYAAGETYGLSPVMDYAAAIGDEPARLAGSSFREILATGPPADFAALWESDTRSFQEQAA